MQFLTPAEAQAISVMRGICKALQDRARFKISTDNVATAESLGIVQEACAIADDALFRVLNVTSSYLADPVANGLVHTIVPHPADLLADHPDATDEQIRKSVGTFDGLETHGKGGPVYHDSQGHEVPRSQLHGRAVNSTLGRAGKVTGWDADLHLAVVTWSDGTEEACEPSLITVVPQLADVSDPRD